MFSWKITTRCLIGVAVLAGTYELVAALAASTVGDLAVFGAALALPAAAPMARPAPMTAAAAIAP
jgi:hypothetical protein